jgi:hypothetical protein
MLAHNFCATAEIALVSGGATYSEPGHWQNLKLETGIIEFQVAPFVTVVADIRGARYLLRVWWA